MVQLKLASQMIFMLKRDTDTRSFRLAHRFPMIHGNRPENQTLGRPEIKVCRP